VAQQILGTGIFDLKSTADPKGFQQMMNQLFQLSKAHNVASKAVVNFNKSTVAVSTGLGRTSQSMNAASKSAKAFSGEMFHASFAFGAISAGLIAMNKQMTEVVFGFDRNMALVRAVSGATGSEFEKLGVLAREMGAQTEFGAANAAEGLLVLSRMGLTAADSMHVFEPAMKLAQSQQHDMTATTQLLIQQLKVFGKSTEEAADFANVLAATSSRSAADLEKLGLSLSYAGPVAAATGRSFEEVNTILGMMFNAGIRASRAGTSLRFALASLMGTTGRTTKALKSIGLELADISPTTHTFDQILRTLADRLKGVRDRAAVVFDLFGKRAAPAMAAVIEQIIRNRDAFTELQDKVTGTNEVQRQYEVQMQSLSGMMLLVRSNIQELVLGFSDNLMPTLRMVTEGVLKFVKLMQQIPAPIKNFVAGLVVSATVATTVIAAFASMRYTMGLLSGVLKSMGESVKVNIGGLKGIISTTIAASAVQQEFNRVLNETVAARVRENLIRNKANKEAAAEIVNKALAAAAEKKLAVEKWAVFQATINQAFAEGQLTKAQRIRAIQTAEGILQAHGMTAAMEGQRHAANALTGSLGKLKTGIVAVLGSMQLWVSAALIGIPMIIGWLIKANANFAELVRKNKEARKEFLESAKQFQRAQATLAKIELDIAAAEAEGDMVKVNNLLEEYAKKQEQIEEVKERLISQNPELIGEYDEEKKSLIVNNGLLREYVDLKKLQAAEEIEGLPEEVKTDLAIFLSQLNQIKEPSRKISELQGKLDELGGILTESSKEMKKHGDAALYAAGAIAILEKKQQEGSVAHTEYSIQQLQSNRAFKESQKEAKGVSEAFYILRNMLIDLQIETGKSGKEFDKFKNKVKGTGTLLSNLADRADDFIRKLEKMRDRLKMKMALIDADEFRANMLKLDNEMKEFRRRVSEMVKDIDKELAKLATAKGDKAQKEAIRKTLQNARDLAQATLEVGKEYKDTMTDEILDDFLQKTERMHAAHNAKIAKMEEERVKRWDFGRAERIATIKAVMNQELLVRKQQLDKIDRQIKAAEDDRENSNKEHLRNLRRQREDLVEEIIAIENDGTEETKEVDVDLFKEKRALQEKEFEAETQNQLKILENRKKNAAAQVEAMEKAGKKGTKEHRKALADMKEADREYVKALISTWGEAISVIGGAITELASIIDDDLGKTMQNVERMITGVFHLIEGIASENWIQAIAGGLEILLAVINEIARKSDEREQEEKKRQEELQRTYSQLKKSMIELSGSSDKLALEFVDMARNLASLNASMETEARMRAESASDWAKITGELETAGLGGSAFIIDEVKQLAKLPAELQGVLSDPATFTRMMTQLAKVPIGFGGVMDEEDVIEAIARGIQSGFPTKSWDEVNRIAADFYRQNFTALESLTLVSAKALQQGKPEIITDIAKRWTDDFKLDQIAFYTDFLNRFPQLLEDGITPQEIVGELKHVRNNLENLAGQFVELSTGEKLPLVSGKDYLDLMERIFNAQKTLAEETGDPALLSKAFGEKADMIEFAIRNFTDISRSTQLDLLSQLATIDAERAKELEGLIETTVGDFRNTMENIADKFEKGEITYSEAMAEYKKAVDAFGEVPKEMAEEFYKIVREFKEGLMDVLVGRRETLKEAVTGVTDEAEKYVNQLEAIDKKYEEIAENWQGLIEQRDELIQKFKDEAAEIERDSQERITALEEERAAVIGIFDFTETQNQRSKRFVKARELEKKILDEIADADRKITELTEKHENALDKVYDKLEELKDILISIDNVYRMMEDERRNAEETFLKYLDAESVKLSEITGKTVNLRQKWKEIYGMAPLGAGPTAAAAEGLAGYLAGLAPVGPEVRAERGRPVAAPTQEMPTFPVPTATLEDELKQVLTEFKDQIKRSLKYSDIESVKPTTGGVMAAPAGEPWWQYIGRSAVEALGNKLALNRFDEIMNLISGVQNAGGDPFAVKAQHGFSGLVRKPTQFTIGEGNRPEFVQVTPISDLHKLLGGMTGQAVTNVIINESLDFRGAYGITSKGVAEEVYRDVWAPARRRNLDRFFNTRGKVIR
jgi:TP901 family phage tail tape measure protein